MDIPVQITDTLIKRGCILHSRSFDNIDHGKFFVIIGESEDGYVGFFFINSEINDFIKTKPRFAELQFAVSPREYTFLTHDSVVDCHEIRTIAKVKLSSLIANNETSFKGELKGDDLTRILIMVSNSKAFSRMEKDTYFKQVLCP